MEIKSDEDMINNRQRYFVTPCSLALEDEEKNNMQYCEGTIL